ncbi:MAG: efflux RND transporter periplasmic adaptor subunit [Gemmatimonadaceae bacterium]|nr:efflux RND transporter periplasmic adaptor subunit [Gemmatimonadaceae bacterium]
MRVRRWVLWSAVVALGLGCGGGRGGDGEGSDAEGASPPAVVGARTAPVTQQRFEETIDAIGTVAPRPGGFAALSAPVPARVARIDVAVGDHVRRGDALVELERAPFDAAARSADAALTAAQHGAERARRLAAEGIVPRKDADQALAELAQAQVNAVIARRNLELATLRAPIGGVVTRLGAVLGQPVDPSQPIVDIADPAALDVVLELPPAQAAGVHRGDSVIVVAGASAGGEPLGAAIVHTVAATVDTATRTVAVRARLTHPRRTLRIGETVFGRIVVAVHPNAVAVPVQALVPDGEQFKVFVVDTAGIAHARVVTVGARTEREAEITHGLAPGEVVVTYGAYGVRDSATIVPVKP